MPEKDLNSTPTHATGEVLTSSPGHRFMFFCLSLMAFSLFAPTVVLPVLREYGELLAEESRLAKNVVQLEAETERQDRLAEAFLRDAAVNERLALLDLSYRRPDEEIVRLSPTDLDAVEQPAETTPHHPRSALLLPDTWPGWVTRAESWAQQRGLVDLYLDPNLRIVFLLMAGGLIIAAFVLFAPRIAAPPASPNSTTADQRTSHKTASESAAVQA